MKLNFTLCSLFLSLLTFGQNGWTTLNPQVTEDLENVQAYSQDTIFVSGTNGTLLKSEDGGSSFTTLHPGTTTIVQALYFKTADTGFVSTGYGALKRTINGGGTFTAAGSCFCAITDIVFPTRQIGIYSGSGGVYRSTSAGMNFNSTPVLTFQPPSRLETPAPGIILGINGKTVMKSSDSGLTFIRDTVHTLTSANFIGVPFFNAMQGYALTADGYLYFTSDQGASWQARANAGLTNISRVEFIDSLTGFVIQGTARDKIYKTTDGGISWTLDYTSSSPMEYISSNRGTVYVCGQSGLLLKNMTYTGMAENSISEIQVFPNPVASVCTVIIPETAKANYRLCDASGRTVNTGMLHGGNNSMNIENLAPGFYMMLVTGDVNRSIRLIKE